MARVRTIELPWTQQPQEVVRLNAGSPIVQAGIGALWHGSSMADAVTGSLITRSSSASQNTGPSGLYHRVAGTGSLDRLVLQTSADNIGAGNFTVLIRTILRGNLSNAYMAVGRWMGPPSTSDWYLGAGSSFTGSTVDFGVACGTEPIGVSATVPGGWATGVEYTIVGRRLGTTLYVDLFSGIALLVSGSYSSGLINTVNYNSHNLTFGEYKGGGAAYNLDSDTSLLALFPRCLSNAEILALAVDSPWHLFESQRIEVPSAAASAVPNITALSAESILATSAGYRVSLNYA